MTAAKLLAGISRASLKPNWLALKVCVPSSRMVTALSIPTGGLFICPIVTVATIGVDDSNPAVSLATTLKALATAPFCAVVAGVQYALCVLSTTLLLTSSQGVAVSAVLPILSVPDAMDLTTKAFTVPSTSASLP